MHRPYETTFHEPFATHLDLALLGTDTHEGGRRKDDEEPALPGIEVDGAAEKLHTAVLVTAEVQAQ